jgi:hypothetical protein
VRLPWLQMRRLQVRLERLLGLWRLRRLLRVLGALPLVLDAVTVGSRFNCPVFVLPCGCPTVRSKS